MLALDFYYEPLCYLKTSILARCPVRSLTIPGSAMQLLSLVI